MLWGPDDKRRFLTAGSSVSSPCPQLQPPRFLFRLVLSPSCTTGNALSPPCPPARGGQARHRMLSKPRQDDPTTNAFVAQHDSSIDKTFNVYATREWWTAYATWCTIETGLLLQCKLHYAVSVLCNRVLPLSLSQSLSLALINR